MSTALECFHAAHPAEPRFGNRAVLGLVLIITTPISFVLNVLLIIVVRKTTSIDRNFGLHVISLIASSIVYLLANLFALIPTVVGNVHYQDPWNVILTLADNLGYLALMFTTTNVALDRFAFFFIPRLHHYITEKYCIFVAYASIPWLLSILYTIGMATEGCYTRTDPYTLSFSYNCSGCNIFLRILNYFGYIFPGINFILYCLIYIRISMLRFHLNVTLAKTSTTLVQPKRKEISLVFQFSIICALQFASSASFYILPSVMPGNDLAYHLPMIISTLNTMTNPCVLMIFQRRIRDAFIELITNRSLRAMKVRSSNGAGTKANS